MAHRVTSCPSLLRAEEFPGLGTFREKTETVLGNPGWLFVLKMGRGDPNYGVKELRLQIHKRVSKPQNFKKPLSPMMKIPKDDYPSIHLKILVPGKVEMIKVGIPAAESALGPV